MKIVLAFAMLVSLLSACGGGGGGGAAGESVAIEVPSVSLQSGSIARTVVSGTTVTVDVTVQSIDFNFVGELRVSSESAVGLFLPAVSVKPLGNSRYKLSLASSTTVLPGRYTGTVVISLCGEPTCATRQVVPLIAVPFDVNVMSHNSLWPGDNLTTIQAWQGAPDWGTFQGNAAHTGFVPVDINPDQIRTRWSSPFVNPTEGRYERIGTLTTENGLFFAARNKVIYARKEFDGSQVWQYDFSALQYPSVNPPAVANGVVYIAAGQQSSASLFAFSAADGMLLFSSPMSSQWEHYLAPTIGSNTIFSNAGAYGGLYAFDTLGARSFFSPMAQTSTWTPALDATGVYIYDGGALKVVDPTSGAVLRSISDPTFTNYVYEIGGSPVLGGPGSVFVANYANATLNGGLLGNTLINFDLTSNSIRWSASGNYPSSPAYANGVVYVANERPTRLEARTESDGAILWSWVPPQEGEANFKSEVLLTNNMVFVSTNLATYGIDINTHKTVWSYPQVGRLAVSKSGILYVQGTNVLLAFNLK